MRKKNRFFKPPIEQMYLMGLEPREIATLLGYDHPSTVYQVLAACGIRKPTRDKSKQTAVRRQLAKQNFAGNRRRKLDKDPFAITAAVENTRPVDRLGVRRRRGVYDHLDI